MLLVVLLALVVSLHAQQLSEADKKSLELLRSGIWDEVGGFELGVGQQSSLLVTLLTTDQRLLCKNGEAAYYKMEGLVNEVFAFYADRLLNMGLVPPAVVSEFRGRRIKTVRDRDIVQQFWRPGDPMVCSLYYDDLRPAIWPKVYRRQTYQINTKMGKSYTDQEKRDLEFWGQVIAFDFLLGNSERLAVALQAQHEGFKPKSKRTTQSISLSRCKHDDCKVDNAWVDDKGQVYLVDNNSGFFYDKSNYLQVTDTMLGDNCVFPAKFVRELGKRDGKQFLTDLKTLMFQNEPEGPLMAPHRSRGFVRRYDQLMLHFNFCLEEYGALSFFKM